MGTRRKFALCIAAAALVLSAALPAGASAAERISLCLNGSNCTEANRIDVPPEVSAPLARTVTNTAVRTMGTCNLVGDQLTRDLKGLGVNAEVCFGGGNFGTAFYRTGTEGDEIACHELYNAPWNRQTCWVATSKNTGPRLEVESGVGPPAQP